MEATFCPSCGAEAGSGFRRCGACGTPLPGAPIDEGMERFATVVTSDLKGSTALGERLDPETLREVLTLYFDDMQAVFRTHGGTIEKIIGDAIVAVFGLPIQHEDDALRAVEAAIETQRVLSTLNDRLEQTWGVRLVVRTGIATGVVVFGQASLGQHILTGDTMQTSTAMEQNSPPLEVLIAQSTYDAVRDSVTVTPADPVIPKGMSTLVPTYRLDAVMERPEAGRAHADTAAAGLQLCPTCGQDNPEAFRLCGMCGSTLVAATSFTESRKTVTIVFADPKPTMVDGGVPGPEALRDVMSRYFEAMARALEQHGGTVEKFIGDAVMAVFGLPVRHEDDALRAVRGAAAMQDALPDLNDEFRARWGLELHNHIGVNSGEVIAGDASLGQRLVTGDAVNTAARLEQAAGPQQIILGALTYRLARDQIEVEPIPPLTLKGKLEPVPAYRLVRVAQRPSERVAATTPFVGREPEMLRLGETLLEVSSTRSCGLLTVIGEAGVGKSRLIREFAAQAAARDRTQVLRGRCLPYGDGVTFWPIAEIVRSAASIDDDDPPDVALAKITGIAQWSSTTSDDSAGIADRVGAAIGLSATQYPGPELFWGIRKLFEAIASHGPLVAIIDDIHFAAPTFLDLLDHLLEVVQDAPVLLLTTARHELLETREEWAERHAAEQMPLEPLSADDADAILDQLLGGLEASVRRRIVVAAEGNPLYVEQITSMLVETGALRREGSDWVATISSDELEIPPTIQALVAARLDALRSEERQVIDPASVIGLGFPVEAVVDLVPREAAAGVPTHLLSLAAKQFVRPGVGEDEFYRFGHSVIKDATYRSLLKRTRADLHERFVGWAEPVNKERGRELEFEEILGYHLEQAYRYRGQLGPMDDATREIGRRAAEKLASAGRRAFGQGNATAAASLIGRAVKLLPPADPDRMELLPELAEALMEQGTFDEAGATIDQAVDLAASIGDRRLQARATLVRYQLKFSVAGSVGGLAVAEVRSAMSEFEQTTDLAGQARAWRLLSVIDGTAGRYDRAAEAAAQVVTFANQVGDVRLAARGAISYAYSTLHGTTPVEEALRQSKEYLGYVRTDRNAEAIILGVIAQLEAMEGRFEQARASAARSREIVADLGASVSAASTSLEASRVERLAGDMAAAEDALRRDYVVLESLGETYFRSTVAALLGDALWRQGKGDEAVAFARIAAGLADDDDVLSQVAWRTVEARWLAAAGRADDAVALARQAVDLAAGTVDIELQADAIVDLAEVLGLSGRSHEQGPLLREALELYERKGDLVLASVVRDRLAAIPSESVV